MGSRVEGQVFTLEFTWRSVPSRRKFSSELKPLVRGWSWAMGSSEVWMTDEERLPGGPLRSAGAIRWPTGSKRSFVACPICPARRLFY